jgi:2-phospho-L-lactate guanylyltransferase
MKQLQGAKSRLEALAGARREELALAMLLDTVAATMACEAIGGVTAVTNDATVRREVARLGGRVADDCGRGDVNAALLHAMSELADDQRCVVILGDLPALRPLDLADVLARAEGRSAAFVPDASGTGTTLLAQSNPRHASPCFGQGSARLHRLAGAAELQAAPSVRRDVDTAEDLSDAVVLGIGPRTTWAARDIKGLVRSQRCA